MNRQELVQKKFPKEFPIAKDIKDPSGNDKYLLWIAKQLHIGHNKADVSATVSYFHENNKRFKQKDIYKYNDLKEVEDLIKETGLSNREEKKELKKGAVPIFENDDFSILRIDTKEAIMVYGKGTKWCITMDNSHYWEDYTIEGNTFYLVLRKNTEALKYSKYIIQRKGLLEFKVYNEKDQYFDNFEINEEEILTEGIRAVINDTPPPNLLRKIIEKDKTISLEQIDEYLKDLPTYTQKFVANRREDYKWWKMTANDVMQNMGYYGGSKMLKYVSKTVIDQIKPKIKEQMKSKTASVSIVKALLEADHFTIEEIIELSTHKEHVVRSACAAKLPTEHAHLFLKDRAWDVFKTAASKIELKDLLDLGKKTRSKLLRNHIGDFVRSKLNWAETSEYLVTKIPQKDLLELIEKCQSEKNTKKKA